MLLSRASFHPVELRRVPASTGDALMPSDQPPVIVRQIMTPLTSAVVVDAKMDVDSLATLLLERGLSCVAVKDHHGAIIGFVSMTDLVRERRMNGDTEDEHVTRSLPKGARRQMRWGFHVTNRSGATVRSIMMPFLLSIPGDSPVDRAAALMAFEGVHRLLVLSPLYDVIGIVSAFDVLRWQARRAGYIISDHTRSAWRHHCEFST